MPKRPAKKQYSFPILKRKMIVCTLQELGISILESDLKSPHEEQCKAIYAQILSTLMGVNMTKQVPFHKLGLFAFPSLHESSIVSVRLFRELIKFMQKVGVTDFSISDLISPESTRTVRNLSAIINFARWRAQKHQIYMEQRIKIDVLQRSLTVITEQNNELAKHFVELKQKQQSEEPQVEVLRAEIEGLQEKATQEVQLHDQQSETIHTIKKEVKRLKAEEQEKKMLLQQKVDVVHSLDTKIVRSPQRIKKELKMMLSKLQKDKLEIQQRRQSLHYDQNKLAQLELLQGVIRNRAEEMQHIHVLKNERFCDDEKELKSLQMQKGAMEKELKSLHRAHKTIASALAAKKQEFSVLQQKHNSNKREIQIKKKQINCKKEQHSKRRIQKQMQIAKLDKQIEAKKEEMQHMVQQHKAYILQIAHKHRLLAESVSKYHNTMKRGMAEWESR